MAFRICKGCGECCRTLTLQGNDPEMAVMIRNKAEYRRDVIDKDGNIHLIMEMPCKHLTDKNKCAIYGERPTRCKEFPRGEEEFWRLVNPRCGMA